MRTHLSCAKTLNCYLEEVRMLWLVEVDLEVEMKRPVVRERRLPVVHVGHIE